MCGYSYSYTGPIGVMGAQNLLMLFLGLLLGLGLITVFMWPLIANRFIQYRPFRLQDKPQPHDEPSGHTVSHETALEMLRDRYMHGEIEP